METKNILLDTQAFVTNNFDTRSRALIRLRELAQQDRAKVLISEVSVREVEKRITESVNSAKAWVNRISKDARILLSLDESPFQAAKAAYDPPVITKHLVDRFHRFLDECGAEEISHAEASLSDVLDAYFDLVPPFAVGEKRKEFPDAITISSALNWANKKSEKIYVVSGDKDLKNACLHSEFLIHIETIQQFLDIESKHYADNEWITEALEYRAAEVKLAAATAYREGGFYLDDVVDGDIEDIEIEITEITGLDLIEADADSAEVQMSATVLLKANITYPDPGMTHYDKEDGRTYVFEWIEEAIKRQFDTTMTLSLALDRTSRQVENIAYETPDSVGIEAEEDGWPYK